MLSNVIYLSKKMKQKSSETNPGSIVERRAPIQGPSFHLRSGVQQDATRLHAPAGGGIVQGRPAVATFEGANHKLNKTINQIEIKLR